MSNGDNILTKDETSAPKGRVTVSAPALDPAKYRALAGDVEILDEEFDEFLGTLWDIMSAFVQHGFDVKTIPAFFPEIFEEASEDGDRTVDSDEEDTNDDG